MRWALVLLAACATTSQAPQRRTVEPEWGDWPEAIEWIACAVEKVDGADFARKVMAPRIVVVENYHLNGCYDPDSTQDSGCYGTVPPPAVYINAKFPTAWSSPLRYELLCRRRSHLRDGDPRSCDWERWKAEIEPIYARALTECSNPKEEA